MQEPKIPLVSIVGPTATGKTELAINLAIKFSGEIVSGDSMQIYKEFDILSAKPTSEQLKKVPHYLVDHLSVKEEFSVAKFTELASAIIGSIFKSGKLPFLVGGTGLYIDALIYDYHFKGPTGFKIGDFEQKSCSDRKEIKGNFLIVGVKTNREKLRERLKARLDKMFVQELYDEVKKLVQNYGWGSGAMKSNIYEYAWHYLQGELSLEQAKEQCFYEDWHLAKRQITWFKRNPNIIWLELEKIYPFVLKYIQNEQGNEYPD